MLNDFVTGVLKCGEATRIIPRIKILLDFARDAKIPIIYANDAHLLDDEDFKLWPPHAIIGTKGAMVVDELRPTVDDFIVEKRKYSAFWETNLEDLLKKLEVDTVVLVGVATEICVRHTAADAFYRGFKIIVPKDCVMALTKEAQRSGIKYLQTIYGCEITTVNKLIKKFAKR